MVHIVIKDGESSLEYKNQQSSFYYTEKGINDVIRSIFQYGKKNKFDFAHVIFETCCVKDNNAQHRKLTIDLSTEVPKISYEVLFP